MKRKTSALLLSAVMTLGMTPYAFAGDITTNEQVVATSESKEVQTSGTSADGKISYVLYTDKSLVFSGTGTLDSATVHGVDGYYNATSVVIESGITGIGESAFSSCYKMESISIPNTVTTIGNCAFSNCAGLTSVSIPGSVKSLGTNAFQFCGLTSVSISDGVPNISDYAFQYCSELTNVSIPKSVTSIGDNAFQECHKLASVSIPEGVTTIGNNAFLACSSLTSVSISEGVTSIGQLAFYSCGKLTKVSIPSSVTNIGRVAFGFCGELKSAEIAEGLTTIPDAMFVGCSKLESVTMPKSVTKIEKTAFGASYPENLVIRYAGTEEDWQSIDIVNNSNDWWYDENTTAKVIYKCKNHSYTYDLVDSVKWSDDYKSATVEFVCQTCGDKKVVDADVTTKTMAPTCTDKGITTATAKAVLKDEDGKTLQTANISKVAAETPALGHEYEAKFDWAEDGSSAKATISCKRGDDEKTVDAVVTKDEENSVAATCDKAGKNVYVATVEGYDFTDTKEVEVPDQGGHKYKSEVKWSDDYKSAKVEFVCQTCGDKQLVDADVTTKTMAPTCTDQGVTTATAKAVLTDENGKTLQSATTSVVTAVTPALGHAWSEEGTVTKNATCAEEGERTYACTHEGCDEAKTESIGKLTPAVDAQRATDLSIWDRICNRKKITVTSSIVNYEYAAVENGQVGDITARGIVYAATEDLGSDELVIGANGSEAFAVPSGYTEDTYDWDITVKSKSTQYTVRSWVQYTDSNGEFAYAFSDPITVSYNGL